MDYTILGRTGLQVSVLGLGGGGHSRLGQQTGSSEARSIALVQHALELGINFIDTAEAYGTEAIIGQALQGRPRETVIISTKKSMRQQDALVTPDDVRRGLEASLQRLGTDYVDVYHLHGVAADDYNYASQQLVPALRQLQAEGKLRFLGITEAFASDTTHRMISRAVQDECWDVVMVGFNILNQSARDRILPHTRRQNIGLLDMFAVRRALSDADKLRQTVADLAQQGLIERAALDEDEPLGFLLGEGKATSLMDAAYRFCRMEPGVHVVLSGTGSRQHLEENVASILRPPLPAPDRQRLMEIFDGVDTVSGQ
ncbi:MAG: aldo/keto reductase [Abitibacteriaceae bacterium]|nr:aldo/keto reductase [Abditibacteriaceae bacterium]MBV9866123.1 aldo/keto reductase [Abditibacteriaceae bacterium]